MPFLGHNPSDGLDVSPDGTPPLTGDHGSNAEQRARSVVQRFSVDGEDQQMLLEALGLPGGEPVAESASPA